MITTLKIIAYFLAFIYVYTLLASNVVYAREIFFILVVTVTFKEECKNNCSYFIAVLTGLLRDFLEGTPVGIYVLTYFIAINVVHLLSWVFTVEHFLSTAIILFFGFNLVFLLPSVIAYILDYQIAVYSPLEIFLASLAYSFLGVIFFAIDRRWRDRKC